MAELADALEAAVGTGFVDSTDEIEPDWADKIVEVVDFRVGVAREAIAAFTWPTATSEPVETTVAAQRLTQYAGLLYFVQVYS